MFKKTIYAIVLLTISTAIQAQQAVLDPQKAAQIKRASLLYNQGVLKINDNKFQDAIGKFNESLQVVPEFELSLLQRGKCKFEIKDYKGAIDDFMKVLEINPSIGETYFNMGYTHLVSDTSKKAKSIEYFNVAIEKGYTEAFVYYYKGLAQMFSADYVNALESFTKAIEKDSKSALAFHERGSAKLMLNDFPGAVLDYRAALNLQSNMIFAYNNMGTAHTKAKEYPDAINSYTAAVTMDPKYVKAQNNRGIAQYYAGEYKKAIDDFNAALQIDKKYYFAQNNIGNAKLKLKDKKAAIEAYNKALEMDKKFGVAYLNRGMIKESNGDLNGSCADWKTAQSLGVETAKEFMQECK